MPAERLQKIIAAAGVASRRKAEELITSGRVQVNGQMVTELGSKADPEHDHIRVDGKLLHRPERYSYLVLNKPKGYVTTVSDPEKRPTVMDLVRSARGRVYPVGRLDWASEGLLLLTNDGELANALMKASSNVPKTYVVKVAGQPEESKLEKLRRGVSIAEKGGRRVRTAPARIRLIREGDNPWLEVTIVEGRNRQIRKMFEEVGHHVEKIRRVRYGPLSLDMPPGEFRNLSLEEVAKLKKVASGSEAARFGIAGKVHKRLMLKRHDKSTD
jgi:23S rRNA pseudouridine2605 synthase